MLILPKFCFKCLFFQEPDSKYLQKYAPVLMTPPRHWPHATHATIPRPYNTSQAVRIATPDIRPTKGEVILISLEDSAKASRSLFHACGVGLKNCNLPRIFPCSKRPKLVREGLRRSLIEPTFFHRHQLKRGPSASQLHWSKMHLTLTVELSFKY